MKRNGIISLWKFIFAVIIVFYHTQIFYIEKFYSMFFFGGYIGVEFFFVVSGYFFAKSALKQKYVEKNKGRDTMAFVWKRIKKLIPYIVISFLVSFIIFTYNGHEPYELANSIWNLLLLRVFGFQSSSILSPFWYIGVLIFVMFITYPSLVKHKENYILRISPIIVLLVLGFISNKYNYLGLSFGHWLNITNASVFRGLAEMNLGMIIYYISKRLEKVEYTKFFRWFLTIVGELLLILVVIGAEFSIPTQYDMVFLLMISIAVLIISSTKTYEYKLFTNKFTNYLERLSMPMFINQMSVIYFLQLLSKKITFIDWQVSLIAVGLTLICSIIEMLLIDFLKTKNLGEKLKPIIIKKKRSA